MLKVYLIYAKCVRLISHFLLKNNDYMLTYNYTLYYLILFRKNYILVQIIQVKII